jgi:hypothetical protein
MSKYAKIKSRRIPTISGGFRTQYTLEVKNIQVGAETHWPGYIGYWPTKDQAVRGTEINGAILVRTWNEAEALEGVGSFDGHYHALSDCPCPFGPRKWPCDKSIGKVS